MTDDELRKLRALVGSTSRTDIPWCFGVSSDYVRQLEASLPTLLDEVDRLRGAVLRPLDTSEVVAALHTGHVERRIAEGDNAWTSMQSKVDALREALREALNEWEGWACERQPGFKSDRITELRKLCESR